MIGLMGGTGLGEALFGGAEGRDVTVETPFGAPSGPVRVVEWNGLQVALLARHGPGHVFHPGAVNYRANIYALKSLGVTRILASGAVGSLREELRPRELVLVDQIIDKTWRRTPTFFDEGVVAHVEFAEPFCPDLRGLLLRVADTARVRVHGRGTYVCMEGPAFSTRAESLMHRAWGGDLIGMTCMPEAKLAREAEIPYALVALVTDYDCWRAHAENVNPQTLLEEIIGNLKAATTNAIALLRAAIEEFARNPLPRSPIQDALKLALWSDRSRIAERVWQRYGVLLDKYKPV